ncbi:MAG: site-specific integrase [Chloroflexota bacterium]|nr:site-specific integrase [Chloroflexota bacterium]
MAQAAGDRLPSYVTREQARAILNVAATTTHRLLLETLWQSGERVTEVLRLRPCDLDPGGPLLHLVNLKQRPPRGGHLARKAVIVSPDLVAALRALSNDAHITYDGYFFRSHKSQGRPMSYGHCWRLIRQYAVVAGVNVVGAEGSVRPATGRDFRHGAAVNQVRQGVPLSEVQQQLGHARIDTTTIYTKLAARERLKFSSCGICLHAWRKKNTPNAVTHPGRISDHRYRRVRTI